MGNSINAESYYDKAIGLIRQANDPVTLATILLNAGDESFNSRKFAKSLKYFEESGALFKTLDHLTGSAYNLGNIGMVYAEQGRDKLAAEKINEAIAILEGSEDYYAISEYLTYMADIYLKQEKPSIAVEYAQRSLDLANKYGLKKQISESNLKLSELHEQLGNANASLAFYKEHIAARDSVKNLTAIEEMADLRTNFEVSKKQVEVDLLNLQKRNQLIIVYATVIALFLIGLLAINLYRRNKYVQKTNIIIASEKERSDNLLLNILPEETAQELKEHGKVKAKKFNSVTVLFTDFKGFTRYAENLTPEELVDTVDFYFSKFDGIMERYGLEKIKTIGDAYMCAGGLRDDTDNHAHRMVNAAFEIAEFVRQSKEEDSETGARFDIRLGINTGPVVAGVVGTHKFAYDIWGDTVNVASRMESNSEAGKINISENTYELVKDEFKCDFRGIIDVKNRGEMKMYFVSSQ